MGSTHICDKRCPAIVDHPTCVSCSASCNVVYSTKLSIGKTNATPVGDQVCSEGGRGIVNTMLRCTRNVNHGAAQLQVAGRVGPSAELTKTLLLRYQMAVSWVLAL